MDRVLLRYTQNSVARLLLMKVTVYKMPESSRNNGKMLMRLNSFTVDIRWSNGRSVLHMSPWWRLMPAAWLTEWENYIEIANIHCKRNNTKRSMSQKCVSILSILHKTLELHWYTFTVSCGTAVYHNTLVNKATMLTFNGFPHTLTMYPSTHTAHTHTHVTANYVTAWHEFGHHYEA